MRYNTGVFRLFMRITYPIVGFLLLLTACGSAPAPQPVAVEDTTSSSTESTVLTESSESSSSREETPLPYEEALDKTFESQTLGIALRYPSTMYDDTCRKGMPVTVYERESSIEFIPDDIPGTYCMPITDPAEKLTRQNDLKVTVHVRRATSKQDVRKFIDDVFSPDCDFTEEAAGNDMIQFFLSSKHPETGEPDFLCPEVVRWNAKAGVVLFSRLGSKNGGGFDWPPSPVPFFMSDGAIGNDFDYPIIQSIRYLEP